MRRLARNSKLRRLVGDQASQIIEFAVALPLLVVFVVGIFDFGQAFNLKQKLIAAAREGARHAASLPTNDLETTASNPPSINSVRDHVDAYLTGAQVNDCGMNVQSPVYSPPLVWTYFSSTNGCPSTFKMVVDRGSSFTANIGGNTVNVLGTRVTLYYPYVWHFNSVIQLIAPGSSYAGVTQITADAIVANEE